MKVEISSLSNGLVVLTDPMPGLRSAVVGVWVNAGTRNETRPQMGLSHMLEHMAFKGTERRSARAISEEIETVGGYLNAYTSREQTAFHARVLTADIPLALDLVSDILTAPAFEQNELERERHVVLQEIGQVRDTPDDILFDHLQSVIYPGQPMGFSILGEEATVASFTRDDLKAYMAAQYRAPNMILVSSGAVDHAAIVEAASRHLSSLSSEKSATPLPAVYSCGDRREKKDLEQVHIAYAFPGVSNVDPDYYVAQVYVTALGGGMSSRLFQEAREKRGLCYSISAFAQSAQESGILGVSTGTGEKEAGEISAVIAGEMASLAETATEEEVARARAQLKSGLLMGLERPGSRAEQIAGQYFAFGRVLSIEEMIAKLEAVDAGAVRKYGSQVMSRGLPAMSSIGPIGQVESYDLFAQRFGGSVRRAAE